MAPALETITLFRHTKDWRPREVRMLAAMLLISIGEPITEELRSVINLTPFDITHAEAAVTGKIPGGDQ